MMDTIEWWPMKSKQKIVWVQFQLISEIILSAIHHIHN
ncbi:unnamed protein product [Schistosoma mattheei]|uniref:Uncharacterized protein n=1 Tax=Schistosoma mattheei TaxID=31246 RepID=A0A183NKX6_9TREM|nr:unnamed protein product [Schistosoma mattheei]